MEFLIWIAFLIVYSIIQSLGKKKKPTTKSPTQVPGNPQAPPTLADALREIQEALQQPQKNREAPPVEQPTVLPQSSKPRSTTLSSPPNLNKKREPEFHSLEKRIPEKATLESQTKYSEKILDKGTLESSKTYEDVFPESAFYDDSYSHAHMDTVKTVKKAKAQKSPAEILRKRLKDPTYLSEAFVIQQILGPPVSKQR